MLAALLDGMDAALCAFDAEGVLTHWNREAERLLGWSAQDAVGCKGFAGWAVRTADAPDVERRLLSAMHGPARQVHEFALLTKSGGRVLVRTQTTGVTGPDGSPRGVYCAFSEVHAQIDLERSVALGEALLGDACWGAVLVDADLRPAIANSEAARAFQLTARTDLLGRPLGDFVEHGLEELEGVLQHVLGEGAPPAPTEIWVTLRSGSGQGSVRRCWRSGFLRLGSPLAQEPVPLGVAWLFQDVTEAKRQEQETARLRFRSSQLHRAARAAAECESPMEAATVHLDFALVGFADHVLLDLLTEPPADREADPAAGQPHSAPTTSDATAAHRACAPPASPTAAHLPHSSLSHAAGDTCEPLPKPRLVRAAVAPSTAPGRPLSIEPCLASGIPVGYAEGHPALQALLRCGAVRASAGGAVPGASTSGWAAARKWPEGTAHGLCAVLRSRGRSLGVVTYLRTSSRAPFDRGDTAYAEEVALRVAASVDLAHSTG